MDKRDVKAGDLVRLTDPISNGEIVRIDNVDEYGFASWIGGSQAADMKQIFKDIFQSCKDKIISEIKCYLENKKDKCCQLEENPYKVWNDIDGLVITYYFANIFIDKDGIVKVVYRYGLGTTPQDTNPDTWPLDDLTMDELWAIIQRIE